MSEVDCLVSNKQILTLAQANVLIIWLNTDSGKISNVKFDWQKRHWKTKAFLLYFVNGEQCHCVHFHWVALHLIYSFSFVNCCYSQLCDPCTSLHTHTKLHCELENIRIVYKLRILFQCDIFLKYVKWW